MSAGTITLTNNSAAVSGAGTAFTADLKAGDFIVSVVGGVTYTLPVKTVNSATGVTLLKNYDGPTQAGTAWSAVPRDTMNAITAQLAAETAQALRGLNYDKQNWQQVFSGTGNVTVKLPDGSSFTGPAWGEITTEINGRLEKDKNLTDLADKVKSRDNLGLGSAATKSVGLSNGNVMGVGAFGLGDFLPKGPVNNKTTMFYEETNGANAPSGDGWWTHLFLAATSYYRAHLAIKCTEGTPRAFIHSISGNNNAWGEIYTTANTTKSTDGTLKAASPIVKIFGDGGSELNSESEGVEVNRESVGVYRISNVLGMNSDGAWGGIDGGFDVPKDRNGQRLLWLDYEVEADGSILVKTYHRTYPDAPAFARNIKEGYEEGDLIDIPSDQFVSVRVEMPQDSIWNLAQKAAQEEMEQEKTTEE